MGKGLGGEAGGPGRLGRQGWRPQAGARAAAPGPTCILLCSQAPEAVKAIAALYGVWWARGWGRKDSPPVWPAGTEAQPGPGGPSQMEPEGRTGHGNGER